MLHNCYLTIIELKLYTKEQMASDRRDFFQLASSCVIRITSVESKSNINLQLSLLWIFNISNFMKMFIDILSRIMNDFLKPRNVLILNHRQIKGIYTGNTYYH